MVVPDCRVSRPELVRVIGPVNRVRFAGKLHRQRTTTKRFAANEAHLVAEVSNHWGQGRREWINPLGIIDGQRAAEGVKWNRYGDEHQEHGDRTLREQA